MAKVGTISQDLRERIVFAYTNGLTNTYAETARMFGVGEATVSRLLRRLRETGGVRVKPRGGNNPIKVDDAWVQEHAKQYPDARLIDRVEAWEALSGIKVTTGTMWNALDRVGWTHKKNPIRQRA